MENIAGSPVEGDNFFGRDRDVKSLLESQPSRHPAAGAAPDRQDFGLPRGYADSAAELMACY